jgi:L-rhamnose-H+ transport protein
MHGVGAIFAANCYVPQKFIRRWSWETFWIVQAAFCWLLWPIVGALLTIPRISEVLAEAFRECPECLLWSFLFSLAYGVGGIAFNVSIRYIGFSLTYAVAVGLSAVLGTLIPPLVRGQLGDIFQRTGSGWILIGIVVGVMGIAACGIAGRFKEADLAKKSGSSEFNLGKGLLLSLLAGVLSAMYGFAIEVTAPVIKIAEQYGAGYWKGNIAYLTANTGAFLTSLFYCLWLSKKNHSRGEFMRLGSGPEKASLFRNYIFAILCGTFWYGQFFFYNLGHVRMGQYEFTSWAIHMIMLVLFSNLTGILFREWKGSSVSTKVMIFAGLVILTLSVLTLTYGNYLGTAVAK